MVIGDMEDENGLELSLGLGCGGSSAKSKGKNGCSSDNRIEEGDRGTKLVDDFKSFLHAGTPKPDASAGSQMSDSVKPQENFFNDLSRANSDVDASINLTGRGLWVSSSRPADIEEEKRPEVGNKRKLLDAHHSDFREKKASHISITTEDGSTAENEDVAESDVEGSTSRLVSHLDDGPKRGFIGVGGPSDVQKEVCGFSDSSAVDLQAQKRTNGSSETDVTHGNLNYGVQFSVRPANIMNMPYSFPMKESSSIGAPATSGHMQGMMQVIPTSNGEQRMGTQSSNPGNLPVMFGYSPIQLPTLDKDNSWGMVSHLPQFHPAYASRGAPNLDKQNDGLKITPSAQVISRNSSEPGRTLERVKSDGKQHVTEEGSSNQTEDDVKGSSMNLRAKDASTTEVASFDFSAIKPGIASDMKFGGCGSYPNLPWVSTTGSGPNGRTISGVTYKFSTNQIKIVCACHGSHMSPEEFVRHASDENVDPDNGGCLASFPNTNPAASAQS
ncbi:ninja-family protein mc410 isoform X2 [Euphorbia lathyris]|uniref:ninja-family protein mc410 isoform X2 n=1 Tax=Euphorbia lathyris TaxID=212925 RepID=UPI0033139D64